MESRLWNWLSSPTWGERTQSRHWLNGTSPDRGLPAVAAIAPCRVVIPPQPSPVLYVVHVAGSGVELFNAVCARDMEGVVAKLAAGLYTPDETTWVKIKNPRYSQAEGRADFFDARAAGA
jgi:hypothetical protein